MTEQTQAHSYTRDDGVGVVTLSGDLDIDGAPTLLHTVESLFAAGTARVVIDMSGVAFMDSGGLNGLLLANRRARAAGGWLRLAGVQNLPSQVARIVGMDQVIPMGPDVERVVADGHTAEPDEPTAALG